jgi:GT2 family glycosyltransferase
MKILIITVNYNNSQLTVELAENIHKIFPVYDFFIVDNNSDEYNKSILQNIKNGTIIFNKENSGYFQGINLVLQKINADNYDNVIICNNDIIFDTTFYTNLESFVFNENIYAISPRIYDMDGTDKNPMIDKKITWFRKIYLALFFMNYYFGRFIYKIVHNLKEMKTKKQKSLGDNRQILMGYGAIYILTKSFFSKNKLLDHPLFLWGEEYFLAYQIFNTGGIIFFNKDLIIYHKAHASSSQLHSKEKFYITRESYKKWRYLLLKLPHVYH